MIEVKELTKYYGDKPGVCNISFTINKGETVGLLGPNGAGKTTIMKMLAGHMLPSAGTIEIDGIDAIENPKEAASHIGFMPEIPPLYIEMDVYGYLEFVSEIRGVKNKDREAHLATIMDLTSITDVKNRLIKNLSKGYRQRVGLAHALVGFPDVLILDEPTVGLDPKQITEVRKLIEDLGRDHTILLSSHILSEIKVTCKRIIIVSNGRIVLEDTVKNLEEGGSNFSIKVKGNSEEVYATIVATDGVKKVTMVAESNLEPGRYSHFLVEGQVGNELREKIFNRFAEQNMPIVELRTIGNSLEEIFLEHTAQTTNVNQKA